MKKLLALISLISLSSLYGMESDDGSSIRMTKDDARELTSLMKIVVQCDSVSPSANPGIDRNTKHCNFARRRIVEIMERINPK